MFRLTHRCAAVGACLMALAPLGCAHARAQGGNAEAPRASASALNAAAQSGAERVSIEPLNVRPAFDYFGDLDADSAIPTPKSVLGYEIGDAFTPAANIRRYLEAVASASDRVDLQMYGLTNERRALMTLVISSPKNLARLDDILARNRELADPRGTSEARAKEIIASNPAIVWFSYNVHGNEASSSEAAMQVVYTLAAGRNKEIRDILDDVVLVVDPMINPDGRDRYVNWYNQMVAAGQGRNASPDAAEHVEPWPGGRTNHYYFDLNRDWLWLTQVESQQRLAVYQTVLPQLHIDYHEQGTRSPYFFGAGAEPYNKNIPDETLRWVEKYGAANAKVFDAHGLVYATKERFDYLYPGYGKVLPVYHGAIGMLCEQAGHGAAGLAVDIKGDFTLTLRQRSLHHYFTGLSYLETTAANRQGQLERFRRFFVDSMAPENGDATAFVIDADNDSALLGRVWDLCQAQGIEIETLDESGEIAGLTSYKPGGEVGEASEGSWVIRTAQPMGHLVKAVFEKETAVSDPDTYDITAWSLPVVFGLRASFTNEPMNAATTRLTDWSAPKAQLTGEGEVAVMVDANQHRFPVAVGIAVKNKIFARFTGGEVTTADGVAFGPGSLIVHTIRNSPDSMQAFVDGCLDAGLNVHRVGTGMTSAGFVLGANDNGLFELPRVLLVRGAPTSGNSFGQHWWLLDVEQPIPYTVVNADRLESVDLGKYNVVVLPDLSGSLSDGLSETLGRWVRAGGVLVATGRAATWASEQVLDLGKKEKSKKADDKPEKLSGMTYAQRKQKRVVDRIPGALLLANIDTTNPLAAGMNGWIGVLKRGDRTLPVADDGYVVARFASSYNGAEGVRIGGSISKPNAIKISNKPFMTHHHLGRGGVICFSDDQTFRGFHHAGMRLLLNAIVYGPSLR